MATTVVKTIGTGGDYSTLQAWEDAAPANLVTADQIWQGQVKNQTFTSAANQLTISGSTTDATHYKELTTEPGASFRDNANVSTNALRANGANGALIAFTGTYANSVTVLEGFARISNLQFVSSSTGNGASSLAFTIPTAATGPGLLRNCITEDASSNAAVFVTNSTATNCLFINRRGGVTVVAATSTAPVYFYNCTFVIPSDKTAGTGINGSYNTVTVSNCAMFGVSTPIGGGGTVTKVVTTSYTDATATGWTTIAYDTSTGSGFKNTVDATRDFRIISGSALIGAGSAGGATTDIYGTTRPTGVASGVGAYWPNLTVAVKTIGTGGDYSTLQAWEDAAPANLVTANQIWRGEVIGATAVISYSVQALVVAGSTTDAVRYKELTVAAGASFVDVPNRALRFISGSGACLDGTMSYSSVIDVSEANFHISRLQLRSTNISSGGLLYLKSAGGVVSQMILDHGGYRYSTTGWTAIASGKISNSLIVYRRSGAGDSGIALTGSTIAENCLVVSPAGSAAQGFGSDYSSSTIRNCAVFGLEQTRAGNSASSTATNCATSAATTNWPGWTTGLAFSTATFLSVTPGLEDYQLARGSALIDAGTPVSTTFDIFGTARPSNGWFDIGPFEYGFKVYSYPQIRKSFWLGTTNPGSSTATPLTTRNIICTQQPQRPAQIDWSNPITRGMSFAITSDANGKLRELICDKRPTSDSSTCRIGANGISSAYSNQQTILSINPPPLGEITLFVVCDIDSATNYGALLSYGTSTNMNLPFELRLGTSATNLDTNFTRGNAAGYTQWHISFGSTPLTAPSKNNTIAYTQVADISVAPLAYVQGKSFLVQSVGGDSSGISTSSGGSLYVGKRGDGVTSLAGAIQLGLVWGRVLSAAEIASLAANPWQIFQATSPINWIPAP